MTDDDLIRRGDALKLVIDRWIAHMEQAQRTREYDSEIAIQQAVRLSNFAIEADVIRLAIAALPAVTAPQGDDGPTLVSARRPCTWPTCACTAKGQFCEPPVRVATLAPAQPAVKPTLAEPLEQILDARGAVFDAMVDAAEDAAGRDVSFNVVVGRALRAGVAALRQTGGA